MCVGGPKYVVAAGTRPLMMGKLTNYKHATAPNMLLYHTKFGRSMWKRIDIGTGPNKFGNAKVPLP